MSLGSGGDISGGTITPITVTVGYGGGNSGNGTDQGSSFSFGNNGGYAGSYSGSSGGNGGGGGFVNRLQTALNIAGVVPGIGDFANAANIGISLYQGDYSGAAMSGFAMIPFVGAIGDLARLGRTVDDLSAAARVADRGGFTAAGRSLTKHGLGARPGNALFPAAKGSPSAINQTAHDIVDDILTAPGTTFQAGYKGRFGNVLQATAPDGRGLVFGPNGEFLYFKE